ncbi:hypothetical protein F5Y10DRAFT_231691 [Nemania abortiva]|nr:hypothetical protein F5Y10DRAFT_231691 [Nemania abortiva]
MLDLSHERPPRLVGCLFPFPLHLFFRRRTPGSLFLSSSSPHLLNPIHSFNSSRAGPRIFPRLLIARFLLNRLRSFRCNLSKRHLKRKIKPIYVNFHIQFTMKYLAALSLAMAPLAMAKAIKNVYPVEARDGHSKRTSHLSGGNAVAVEASETQIVIIWVNPGNNAETTTINNAVTVTQTVTAGAADATVGTTTIAAGATGTVAGTGATHTVQVGGSAGLAYSPPSIEAAVGDMVVFTFMSMNHTATQSAFDTPCDPLAGGMDSGFMPNANNTVVPAPQVAMQVMDTKPVWFYCRQTGHCGKGMVFSINPTAEKTQAIFQAMAIQQKGQGAGSAITGGNGTATDGGASSVASDAAATSTAAVATETAAAGGATETGSASGSIQTGTGQLAAGACVCAVTCGAGSFPAVNAQGIGNFGGVPGAIPVSMAEMF